MSQPHVWNSTKSQARALFFKLQLRNNIKIHSTDIYHHIYEKLTCKIRERAAWNLSMGRLTILGNTGRTWEQRVMTMTNVYLDKNIRSISTIRVLLHIRLHPAIRWQQIKVEPFLSLRRLGSNCFPQQCTESGRLDDMVGPIDVSQQ